MFEKEIAAAIRAFDRHIVCLDKPCPDFQVAMTSLVKKAISAYQHRPPGMRHGIALDAHVTVILSQGDGPKPLCGIYFNLHSPYQKDSLPSTVKPIGEAVGNESKDLEN